MKTAHKIRGIAHGGRGRLGRAHSVCALAGVRTASLRLAAYYPRVEKAKTAGIPPCENFSPRRKITARSGWKSSENPGKNKSKPAGNHAVLRSKTAWRLRTHTHTHAGAGAGPTAPQPPYCGSCGGLSGDRWGEINYSGRNAGGGCGTQETPRGVCGDAPQHGDREGLLRNHPPRTHTRGGQKPGEAGWIHGNQRKPRKPTGFSRKQKKAHHPPGGG